jgi:hypothetical protein
VKFDHPKGPNWTLIHELLLAEIKRVQADTTSLPDAKQENLAELYRNNDIAVEKAEKQE